MRYAVVLIALATYGCACARSHEVSADAGLARPWPRDAGFAPDVFVDATVTDGSVARLDAGELDAFLAASDAGELDASLGALDAGAWMDEDPGAPSCVGDYVPEGTPIRLYPYTSAHPGFRAGAGWRWPAADLSAASPFPDVWVELDAELESVVALGPFASPLDREQWNRDPPASDERDGQLYVPWIRREGPRAVAWTAHDAGGATSAGPFITEGVEDPLWAIEPTAIAVLSRAGYDPATCERSLQLVRVDRSLTRTLETGVPALIHADLWHAAWDGSRWVALTTPCHRRDRRPSVISVSATGVTPPRPVDPWEPQWMLRAAGPPGAAEEITLVLSDSDHDNVVFYARVDSGSGRMTTTPTPIATILPYPIVMAARGRHEDALLWVEPTATPPPIGGYATRFVRVRRDGVVLDDHVLAGVGYEGLRLSWLGDRFFASWSPGFDELVCDAP